ncbi:MAG: ABC transporter permease, partial [Opitutaceae bacterium]
MSEEMRAHLELQTRENLARGMNAEDARFAALRSFGGVEQIKERARDQRDARWLEHFLGDLRFAARALRKAPGFSVTVVVTLSLGIGLVTAIVNVAKPVLLPDLAFPAPERLVFLREQSPDFLGGGHTIPTLPRFTTYAERSTSFAGWGTERGETLNLLVGDAPEPVRASVVSSGLFSMLGVACAQGRLFAPEEYEAARAGESVVLSHAAWAKYFGHAAEVVGRDIRLGDRPRRVIGILAPQFRMEFLFERKDGIYLTSAATPPVNTSWTVFPLGRLKAGVTLTQAEAELNAIRPEPVNATQAKLRPWLVSVADAFRQNRATPFRVLLGAAALLHLIGCTAVANLMLSRAVARRRELGVRLALGGSRRRIMALILTEALLLAVLCGTGGACVAAWSQRLMAVLAPAGMDAAQLLQQAVFGRTFGFAVALGVVTCLASAAIPAWRAGRVELNEALKEGAGSLGDSRRLSFLRGLFVVVQTALAVTLLTGAGLLLHTVHRLNSIDLGFAPESKLVVSSTPRAGRGDGRPPAVINAEIARHLAALPGVAVVAQSSIAPAGAGGMAMGMLNLDLADGPVEMTCSRFDVDPDFFALMEMRFLAGSGFADLSPGSRPVAVISESIAKRYFAEGSPIGRILTMNKKPLEIVGVVRDIAMGPPGTGMVTSNRQQSMPQVYTPSWQGLPLPWFSLIVKLRQPLTAEFGAALRRAVFEVDPSAVVTIRTLDE